MNFYKQLTKQTIAWRLCPNNSLCAYRHRRRNYKDDIPTIHARTRLQTARHE